MKISFKRQDSTITAILVNGAQVGTITKISYEQARPIKGTRLRHAKGKTITCYTIRLQRYAFVNATHTQCEVRLAAAPTTYAGAKQEVTEMLGRLTLAPQTDATATGTEGAEATPTAE